VRHEGESFTVETHDPQRDLTDLLMWADKHGWELDGLEVRRPSLEEIFLEVAEMERVAA
jgi:ABC-2 type transport system ATP-binding protein